MEFPRRFLRTALGPVACALLASGCALVDPHNIMGRQLGDPFMPTPVEVVPSPPAKSLSREAREHAFDFVWRTVSQRYHDPALNGVDWEAAGKRYRPLALAAPDDDAFWDVLDHLTGELRDSHTRVESPKRVALRRHDESITLGFSFLPIDGKLYVTGVNGESDAFWAGVRPGMTMVAVNGEPAMDVYHRLHDSVRLTSTERARHLQVVRRLVTGEPDTKVKVAFERADGTRFEPTLTRRKITTRPFESHRVLPSGFGYLRFSQWTLGMSARALEALDALKSTPGLVIDLRGNPGGSVHAVNQVLSRFFSTRTELGHTTTRTGKPVSIFFGTVDIIKLKLDVEGNPDAYKGPVVILLSPSSASGSELFAGTMQAAGRAKVVGEPSCGCLLGFLGYAAVPGGAELAYSEVGFVMSNGRKIEGVGVLPDLAVPPRVEDLRAYRDRALEEAQALLATLVAGSSGITGTTGTFTGITGK